jgi:SPP1 family predicted phage head-tail adaptor
MHSGKLRFIATLQDVAPIPNAYGEGIPSWAPVGTFHCDVKDLSGQELFHAQQTVAYSSAQVNMRYRYGVLPRMRIVVNGRTLQILSVSNPDGRHRELVLLCKEAQ